MAYWLFKSEPSCWSWDNQKEKPCGWDGVRNYQAANNMKDMRQGDLGFFYHSVTELRIMGIVEIIEEYHPDPTDPTGRFGMVTVKAVKDLPNPVTLAQIKAHPMLQDLALVKQSRLSVMPIDPNSWSIITQMGGL